MTEKTAKSNAGKGWLCCVAIIALCVISCFAQNGTYTTKKCSVCSVRSVSSV